MVSVTHPVPRTRWIRIGFLLFLIYLVCFADRSNIGVAAPDMIAELKLSGAVAGALLSAFFWGYVLTQLPGGWLANRLGPHRVVVGAQFAVGITGCLTGLVTTLPMLLVIRFAMGLAEGMVWPSFAILFLNWFPAAERGRAVSLSQYALPLSSVVMAPLAGWMIDAFHWRTMFVMQGIPAIVIGVLFWFVASSDPATDTRISAEERSHILASRSVTTVAEGSFLDVLRLRIVWGFCLTYFLWVTGLYAFGMWAPTVIKQLSQGMAMGVIGWLTAIPYAFATIAMYLVSRAADQERVSRGWFVAAALAVAGIGLIGQHVVAQSLLASMVMLVTTGVGIYAALGAWWSWALANVPRNQAGPAIGLINLFGNFGGICGPLFVGIAAGAGKAADGLYLIGIAMLAGAAIAALIAFSSGASRTVTVDHLAH